LARRLETELAGRGRQVEVLDGDEIRTNLSAGLGFSKQDRDANIRRIGYVTRLLARNGVGVITAAISPYREVRDEIAAQTPNFVEVFVRCSLDELVKRDVKGLYKKALAGEIEHFTGVSDPYEEPLHPAVLVETDRESVEESIAKILAELGRRGIISSGKADRVLHDDAREAMLAEVSRLPRVEVDERALADAYMLASGALDPVQRFMNRDQYAAVVEHGRLPEGQPFTIPVVLRVADEDARAMVGVARAGLWFEGRPIAVVDVEDVFQADKRVEALSVYGTDDASHPGVAALLAAGDWIVAGGVTSLEAPVSAGPGIDLSPAEVRKLKEERGWRTMVGFQTRNPVHRAHEYLQKVALEIVDGLLLHPLMGKTKEDDVPAEVRLRCYQALLEGYYPAARVLLASNPAWMRYAGPKEAVFHAIVRRNYGCTHFIVGRDHAGVGNFYDTYAAHRIFDQYAPGELGIEILRFEHAFYCTRCKSMASTRTCPHPPEFHLALSGTKVRELLIQGEALPEEFSRAEVAAVLREAYRGARTG
jgi:sulfate adenylyltransferase/3'-phosphoadenosine 5'-phosphosulfate synthase